MKKMTKVLTTVLVIALAALTLAGCAKKDTSPVTTDGSTSMEKVIGTLGEAFTEKEGINVTYNPTGSGSGIQAVSEGRCDIGLSSRALKDDEKATLTETVVALDGIAMIVNPENPVSDLTVEQIADIYTGKITNWSEVGGNDAEIVLIGREAGSGTRDGFESITGTKDACQYRQELTSTGDVITTVSQNPDAIGYASLAALKDTVKALTVGGVAPTEETVKDGSYVIQRPFVLVTKTGETRLRAADHCISDRFRPARHLEDRARQVPVRQRMGLDGGGGEIRHSPLHPHERLRHLRRDPDRRAGRVSDGRVPFENGAQKAPHRHGIRGQPARGHPVGRLWPCRHAGAGAGDPEAVSRAGRREPARGHHRSCHHDSAVHHQGLRQRARRRAEGV